MSRLYIHIGAKKTGSTSLQHFLKINHAYLKANGIHVSRTLGSSEDKALSRAYMGEGPKTYLHSRNRFFRECSEFFESGGTAALVSAESLSDLRADEIYQLKQDFDRIFDDYRVILYIRRQDLVAVSHYSTLLRGGGASKKLMSDGLGQRGRRALSYGSVLEEWADAFGASSILCRMYVEKWQGSWDVVDDFLTIVGIDAKNGRPAAGDMNRPLSGEAAAYLRRHNELVKCQVVKSSQAMRRRLVRALMAVDGLKPIPKPAKRLAKKFFESFEDENERVRRTFYPRQMQLFSDNFNMYPEVAEEIDALLSVDYAIRVGAFIAHALEHAKRQSRGAR